MYVVFDSPSCRTQDLQPHDLTYLLGRRKLRLIKPKLSAVISFITTFNFYWPTFLEPFKVWSGIFFSTFIIVQPLALTNTLLT